MPPSPSPIFSLAGRVALVTGSSTGLGLATASCLGRAGAKVAVNYANNAARADRALAELEAARVTARLFRAHVTDEGRRRHEGSDARTTGEDHQGRTFEIAGLLQAKTWGTKSSR